MSEKNKFTNWFIRLIGLSILLIDLAKCNEKNHIYNDGEEVVVWANVMGPFNNPSETYPYFNNHVPFCSKSSDMEIAHDEFHYSKFDGLGSVLQVKLIILC